ncbi:MAG: TniQ family protein [Thalassospira sp.]|uniref:TniQ family protein n=1 Tax=Thalassospira sp. TaxID=1912094 RepID=UPI0032EB8393
MEFSDRLVIRSKPYPNESLIGYLIRITELNHYDEMSWVAHLAGLQLSRMRPNDWVAKLGEIAKIVGQPVSELRSLASYLVSEGNHSHSTLRSDETISRFLIRWPTSKICFQCVDEFGYVSTIADLKFVTHCPHHGARLIDQCPKCGISVRFNRAKVSPCNCSKADGPLPSSASEARLGLMKLLSNKFQGTEFDLSPYCFSAALGNGGLNQALGAISLMIAVGDNQIDLSGKVANRVSFEEFDASVERVANALVGWPNGFFKFVDELCRQRGKGQRAFSLSGYLGKFYSGLRQHADQVPFLWEGLQLYIERSLKTTIVTKRGNPTLLKGKEDRWFLPRVVACRRLGVGRNELHRLVWAGYLEGGYGATSYGEIFCVTRESVDKYRGLKKHLIGRREVARMLGISIGTLYGLAEAGCIQEVHSPRKDRCRDWYFDMRSITEFVTQFENLVSKKKIHQASDAISLKSAISRYNKQGLSYSRILDGIRNKELRLYSFENSSMGFLRWGVDADELRSWHGQIYETELSPVTCPEQLG